MIFQQGLRSLFFITFFLVTSSCGRKYRNIFFFNPDIPIKFETLDFSSVKGIQVSCTESGITISWLPVTHCIQGALLIGYNIYRLTQEGFIPRKPLNKALIQETIYNDEYYVTSSSYIVRAVFQVQDKVKEGPASLVISSKGT